MIMERGSYYQRASNSGARPRDPGARIVYLRTLDMLEHDSEAASGQKLGGAGTLPYVVAALTNPMESPRRTRICAALDLFLELTIRVAYPLTPGDKRCRK